MTTTAIEIVSYKLNQAVAAEKLEEINQAVNEFLSAQEGFYYRSMSQDETGTYFDIAYWQNMELAKKAADAFCQDTAGKALMAITDMESVKMKHMTAISETASCQVESA